MEKTYNPQQIEETWYQYWETQGYFNPDAVASEHQGKTNYSIAIPPPNVTGYLHMGHAFQDTIMDLLIRYHRMKGHKTLWQVGTDHAGIATQMVVERQLAAENLTRHDLGREKFTERVWQWKEESGGRITRQLRRMAASVDWQRERFTMEPKLSEAVTRVFVELHREKLIYRGKRLVNWDPVLHTAISDLEVVTEEERGCLWKLRYPLEDGSIVLTVATTRPETMLGDSAVAVHPDDERYQNLIGKQVKLPLTNRLIPIIADAYVDRKFGTGCVKITPAHDFNDYEMGKRHDLPLINIFNADAKINSSAPEAYQGMDRFAAREKIVADLDKLGLLEATEDYLLKAPRGDRSGAIIEPWLTDQWYVRVAPLAKPAIEAVENGAIQFVPKNWQRTYYDWMHNIEDWCISRQIWWGHRIPAWYDDKGNCYVGYDEPEVRQHYQLGADLPLSQDEDVLDTWFSSALWPFSTLGWPENTEDLKDFYPTSVLVTGFDIIFFWVARMVMMGLKFTGEVPFHQVYIHGLVRDQEGQKMSKSKGNVLDPLDVIDGITLDELVAKRTAGLMQPDMAPKIEKQTRRQFPDGIPPYGTDALRFTFASQATLGRDINFDLARVEGYRNFCTKLWNAARFVLMNTEGKECGQDGREVDLRTADRWILSRLQDCIREVDKAIADYRFDFVANTLYHFAKDQYCDWYIELCKPILMDETAPDGEQRAVRKTLIQVLETLLRLAHPLIPFISEEIWQKVKQLAGAQGESLMLQPWPIAEDALVNSGAENEIAWVQKLVGVVRNIRGEMNIPPNQAVAVLLQNGTNLDQDHFKAQRQALQSLGRMHSIDWLNETETAPQASVSLVDELKVMVPFAGLIDPQEEQERLTKELDKLGKLLFKSQAKLANGNFVDQAPPEVVAKEKSRVEELQQQIEKLTQQKRRLEN